MSDLILHHYPQSPVSEKVRIVLGMKAVAWRSVEIPRLPPKPDLMPLTGGYRLTPVLQAGADVFCDSQCIIREIERRYPEPTLFPGGASGIAWGVSRWTDGPLFKTTIAVVLGDAADDMPAAFAADRVPLYFGPGTTPASLKAALPENLAQLGAQLGWMDQRLADGRDFMLGAKPGLPDALCFYLVWFIRGRYSQAEPFLGRFENLCAWEGRVAAIGHGSPQEMDAAEALDIARDATPDAARAPMPGDPEGLAPGDRVEVCLESGTGGTVAGRLHHADADDVAVVREDPRVGQVAVHFPRVGSRVTKV